MAEERIDITADATTIVRTISQVIDIFGKFNRVVQDTVKSTERFNAAGKSTGATLTSIDRAGVKTLTTFKNIDGVMKETASTITRVNKAFQDEVTAQGRLAKSTRQLTISEARLLIEEQKITQATRTNIQAIKDEEAAQRSRSQELQRVIELRTREAAAIERSRTARNLDRQVTRGGPRTQAQFGAARATQAEVIDFQNARSNLREFVQANEIAKRDIVRIFREVRAGIIKSYTGAARVAQQRILEIINAQKRLGAEARKVAAIQNVASASQERSAKRVVRATERATAATREFTLSWRSLLRIVSIQVSSRFFFALISQLQEATKAAIDLGIAIGEVQTIDKANQSFAELEEQLFKVSNAFGLDILDVVEAKYQTLSNQVAEGTEAFRFLEEASRFAITTNSSLADSVNLLTGAINSFGLVADDVTEVSAIMFKTIEEGRVRASELANTFGRVGVVAAQLGIPLEEITAGISLLTINGVKASEAQTLLRNILLKMIRPTDALKAKIAELGFESAASLFRIEGLGGGLALLEESVGGSIEGIGELFGRIRAITGALGFAGDNAEKFQRILASFGDAGPDLEAGTLKVLDTQAKQLQIGLNQVRNFFIEEFGTAFIDTLEGIVGGFENLRPIVRETIRQVKLLAIAVTTALIARAVVPLAISLIRVNTTTRIFTASLSGAARTTAAFRLQLVALKNTFRTLLASNPFGALLVGVTVLTEAMFFFLDAGDKAFREITDRVETLNDAMTKFSEDRIKEARDVTAAIKKEIDKRVRFELQGARGARAQINSILKDIKEFNEDVADSVKDRYKEIIDGIKEASKEIESNLKRAASNVENILKQIESGGVATEEALFQRRLEEAPGADRRVEIIDKRREVIRKRAEDAARSGDSARIKTQTAALIALGKLENANIIGADKTRRAAIKERAELEKQQFEISNQLRGLGIDQEERQSANTVLAEISERRAELLIIEKESERTAARILGIRKNIVETHESVQKILRAGRVFAESTRVSEAVRLDTLNDQRGRLEQIAKIIKDTRLERVFDISPDRGGPEGALGRIKALNKLLAEELRIREELKLATPEDKGLTQNRQEQNLLKLTALVGRDRLRLAELELLDRAKASKQNLTDIQQANAETERSAQKILGPATFIIEQLNKATEAFSISVRESGDTFTGTRLTDLGSEIFSDPFLKANTQLVKDIRNAVSLFQSALRSADPAETKAAIAALRQLPLDNTEAAKLVRKAIEELRRLSLRREFAGGFGRILTVRDEQQARIQELAEDLKKRAAADKIVTDLQIDSTQKFTKASDAWIKTSQGFDSAIINFNTAVSDFDKLVKQLSERNIRLNPDKKALGGAITGSTDRINALLSRGETVINSRNTSRFKSTLLSINAGTFRPRESQNNGEVNMGDLNVTIESSNSTDTDVLAIGKELQRHIRSGTLDLSSNRRF